VHREVGALHELGDSVPSTGQKAMPMLAPELTGTPGDIHVGGQVSEHPVEDRAGERGVDVRQHEPELVAAEASDRVARAQHLGQRFRDVAEVVVAVVMPEGVVDLLNRSGRRSRCLPVRSTGGPSRSRLARSPNSAVRGPVSRS
jgi:hypothetical protein